MVKVPAIAEDFLRSVGATDIDVEIGGKHPRLVFSHAGTRRFFVMPSTPSNVWNGERNMLSVLRHMTGAVATEKRIGQRRSRKIRRARTEIALPTQTGIMLPDWRVALLARASPGELRALADLAWLNFWRDAMRSVGAVSRL